MAFAVKQNEGTTDRAIRVVLGLIVLFVAYTNLSGTAQIIGYIVGVGALVTGIVGFCGVYALLGISTCKR